MRVAPFLLFFGVAAVAAAQQCTADKPELLQNLLKTKVVDKDRILVHCSHTCDLRVAGDPYHVLDVRELVKNVSAPRGVNRIVVLNAAWGVVKTIPYADERPLFCRDNQLVIFGEMSLPEAAGGPGNVIVFRTPALEIEFRSVDWVSLPTLREQRKKP